MGRGLMKIGSWLPDQPPHGHDGLVVARNVFATPMGYGPVKDYSAVTAALPETYQGGRVFIGIDGTVALLVGTSAGLYRYNGTGWDAEHADTYSNPWQFAQFGDLVIGAQGAAPVKYDISAGTAALLGGTPPNGKFITTVKDFVVIAGVDSANSTVYWSAINNAEGWTIGTDQADSQVIPDGGEVTGIAGGEYLLVFQREQIWRGQYVGTPLIYQFDKISQGVGCAAFLATFLPPHRMMRSALLARCWMSSTSGLTRWLQNCRRLATSQAATSMRRRCSGRRTWRRRGPHSSASLAWKTPSGLSFVALIGIS